MNLAFYNSALADNSRLRGELILLRSERDEARRLACEFWVKDSLGYSSSIKAKEDALARGWDCFKEETP